jgi:hypothetical protein
MTRARGRNTHAGGGMLDHSITPPLLPSSFIAPMFYVWIDEPSSKNLYIEYRESKSRSRVNLEDEGTFKCCSVY